MRQIARLMHVAESSSQPAVQPAVVLGIETGNLLVQGTGASWHGGFQLSFEIPWKDSINSDYHLDCIQMQALPALIPGSASAPRRSPPELP